MLTELDTTTYSICKAVIFYADNCVISESYESYNGRVSHRDTIILSWERAIGHKWPYITNLFVTVAAYIT